MITIDTIRRAKAILDEHALTVCQHHNVLVTKDECDVVMCRCEDCDRTVMLSMDAFIEIQTVKRSAPC